MKEEEEEEQQQQQEVPSMGDLIRSGLESLGVKQANRAHTTTAHKCETCGKAGHGRMLHRLRHHGSITHLCSSCVLFYHRYMYCSLCYQVYSDPTELGDPALCFTCSKCLSLSHLHCHNQSSDSSSICHRCCSHSSSPPPKLPHANGSLPEPKKPRLALELGLDSECRQPSVLEPPIVDQETLAAFKLVAIKARKDAQFAKAKVFALAEVSAKAVARAKAALDIVYITQQEGIRSKAQLAKHPTGSGQQVDARCEDMEMQLVGNDHARQAIPIVTSAQENEIMMDMPSLHPYVGSEAKETEVPFNEVTIQDFLLMIHDLDDLGHNNEMAVDVTSLSSSEGVLNGSSEFDMLQEPHHSCIPRSEGYFSGGDAEGFVEGCPVEESDDIICELASSLPALSNHCKNHEFHAGLSISVQATSDVEMKEAFLHEVDLSDRGLLQFHLLQDKGVLDTDIFSSEVN